MVYVFSNQQYQIGYILEGLEMTNLVYFMAIWNLYVSITILVCCTAILYFCGHADILFHILVCSTKKNLATLYPRAEKNALPVDVMKNLKIIDNESDVLASDKQEPILRLRVTMPA
jgi:hypothetical protein